MIKSQNLVHVYYHGFGTKQLVGRLLWKNKQMFFEYDASFIKLGLELSPFKLRLQSGVISSTDSPFEKLFGVFNDSLPDGWGRLLIDRKLISLGLNPNTFSPLDRLCHIGSYTIGALSYEPTFSDAYISLITDLDEIDHEVASTLAENNQYLDSLLVLNGSSCGARPKALLKIDNDDWLIKFRSSFDPEDIGAIEYAYHLMAVDAGLNVPVARLFASKNGHGFFGVQRFDRKNEQQIHIHTISGLLHSDHREPSLDYEIIMKATLHLTRDIKQCEAQFRNAVFNVLSHNRDDHSKNFSFLMDAHGTWVVSPAYDLTFSFGPCGEHSTMVMGEGKNPTQNHLLRLAEIANINRNTALEIIEQTLEATNKWKIFAHNSGVSYAQMNNIDQHLKKIK